jgi:hypothetical protein
MQELDPKTAGAIREGLAWLAEQQGEDGGWHSATYGSMRGGAAITGLVLYAASAVDERLRGVHGERWRRGVEFLAKSVDDDGCPRNPDKSVDFPTYVAALLLPAAARMKADLDREKRTKLIEYVLATQICEARGFEPESPHYGGWELTGDVKMRGFTTGANISVTCFAVEALAGEKSEAAETARRRAMAWLSRCQNFGGEGMAGDANAKDGGFFFQADRNNDANKAQWTDEKQDSPRSYGTATADGLRAMVAAIGDAEKSVKDERVIAAAAWLEKRDTLAVVPGFPPPPVPDPKTGEVEPFVQWPLALRFYYYASLGRAIGFLPAETREKRRTDLRAHVAGMQHEDGRWENPAHHMRENDPLIATSLALLALA